MDNNTNGNNKIEFLDILSIMSFAIGLENYNKNVTLEDLHDDTSNVIQEIHKHLEEQDKKINLILEKLGGAK